MVVTQGNPNGIISPQGYPMQRNRSGRSLQTNKSKKIRFQTTYTEKRDQQEQSTESEKRKSNLGHKNNKGSAQGHLIQAQRGGKISFPAGPLGHLPRDASWGPR